MCARHAELLALVDVRGTAMQMDEHAEGLRRMHTVLLIRIVAPASDHARLVVVAGEQTRPPAVVHGLLLRLELLAQVAHIELDDVPLRIALVNAHMVEQE